MNCKKCGEPLQDNENICSKCGADNRDADENAAPAPVAETAAQPRGFSSKKNIIIIALAGVLALGIGGTAAAVGISNAPANRVSRYMGAAERYLSEMNYEQAVIEFQRILEIEPMNVDAYLGMAEAYIAMGDIDNAIETLRTGYEKTGDIGIKEKLDALETETALSRGKQYLSESRFNEAVEQFEKVLGINEKNVEAYLGLADAYLGLGDTEKAMEILRNGYEKTGDSRLQAKIDELTEPETPVEEEEISNFKPEYGSMGSVTILGTELDIATTERLLIFNEELYQSGNWSYDILDEPETHFDSIIYLDGDLSVEEYNKIALLSQLELLEIDYAGITNLSPLVSLTNLIDLHLESNQISDITVLANLTNLTYLTFGDNQISDITPLIGLTNLETLGLWNNQISDITPLKGLINLKSLDLSVNQISDITPLAGLTNLQWLYLHDNQISDITSLSNLINLESLNLTGNPISDADIQWLRAQLPNCEIDMFI